MNGNLEVRLIHQWKSSIYIQYKVISQWPIVQNLTHFEVHVHGDFTPNFILLSSINCGIFSSLRIFARHDLLN